MAERVVLPVIPDCFKDLDLDAIMSVQDMTRPGPYSMASRYLDLPIEMKIWLTCSP